VAGGIRCSTTVGELSTKEREAVEQSAEYLLNDKDMLK
jgi:hypothetical protein